MKSSNSGAQNSLTARIAVLCAILAVAQNATQAQTVPQQTLVPTDGFPRGSFLDSLQQWLDLIQPVRFQVTTPASPIPPTIEIAAGTNGPCPTTWCSVIVGTIWVNNTTPIMANENVTGLDPQGLVHEMMHQSLNPKVLSGADIGFIEALATGKTDLIYLTMRKQNPLLFPVGSPQPSITEGPTIDIYNNRRATVFGGATNVDGSSNFYANFANTFNSPTSLLAHLINEIGGDYRKLDTAINAALPRTRADFLAILDKLVPLIDGVPPSTYMGYDVTNFAGTPPGTYFGISPAPGSSTTYQTIGSDHWPFNPPGFDVGLVQFKANSAGEMLPTWINSPFTGTDPIPMFWSIHDAAGNLMASRMADARKTTAMVFAELNSDGTFGNSFYQTFPTGSYSVDACLTVAVGSTICKPELQDSYVFAILQRDALGNGIEYSPGDVEVITNDPIWGRLKANTELTLISPLGITVEKYFDRYVYRNLPRESDDSFQNLVVTDGTYIRTFKPETLSPTLRYFHRRYEPVFKALTRSTDFQVPQVVVPGAIYSIFGSGLTENASYNTSKFPLSTEGSAGTDTNDQGRTEVVFGFADGTKLKGFFLYVSKTQINFVSPSELANHIGETATVTVVLNGNVSMQSIQFKIGASDPTVFVINTANTPAAIFAAGPKKGQLVTPTNPVSAGDAISIFGTGLGPKMMTPSNDGMPMNGVDWAQVKVAATIGGISADVTYAGSAPGFVGLDQINVVVPEGMSGTQPLVLTSGTMSSATVMIPII